MSALTARLYASTLLLGLATAACSRGYESFEDVPGDVATLDATRDSTTDASRDGAMDAARLDAGRDATTTDTGMDVPRDMGTPDTGRDVPVVTDIGPSMCTFPVRETLLIPANVGGVTTTMADINMGSYVSNFSSFGMCPTGTMTTVDGEDHVYQLNVTSTVSLEITASGLYAPLVAVRSSCDDMSTQIACTRLNGALGRDSSTVNVTLNPGVWYVVIDRVTSLSDTYTLSVTRR